MTAILLLSLLGLGLAFDFATSDEDEGNSREIDIPERDFEVPDVVGDNTANLLSGDDSDNTMEGGRGDDTLNGRDGDDTIYGGAGDDELNGQQGDDQVIGGSGDDLIRLGDGDDSSDPFINSNEDSGNDTIWGRNGDDVLVDGRGDDELYGQAGNDFLVATDEFRASLSPGAPSETDTGDLLDGGTGDDILVGDNGDTLTGGSGEDIFFFDNTTAPSGEAVTLTDFDVDEDVFSVINLDNPTMEPNILFLPNGANGTVQAYVGGQKVAILEGLTANDIPHISTAVTNG